MKKLPVSILFLLLYLASHSPVHGGADFRAGLKTYYPGQTFHLPQAVDTELEKVELIQPGITHHHAVVWTINGPLNFHLLFVDITRKDLFLKTLKAHEQLATDAKTLTGMATNIHAIVGVSCSFPAVSTAGSFQAGDLFKAISSAPVLVKNNEIPAELKNATPVRKITPTALSGVGILKSGRNLVMVTVDARPPHISIGLTPPQFAEYFQFLGCSDALLLNSGDYVTMTGRRNGLKDATPFNIPSGAMENTSPGGLFIISEAPAGKPDRLIPQPESLKAIAGQSYPLSATLIDAFNHVLETNSLDIKVKPANLGEVEATQFTAGIVEGKGAILLEAGGKKAKIPLQVINRLKYLRLNIESAELLPDEELSLELTGVTPDGESVEIPATASQWNAPPSAGAFAAPGRFHAGKASAGGYITASALGLEAKIPLAVGKDVQKLTDFSIIGDWRFKTGSPRILGGHDIIMATVDGASRPVSMLRYDFKAGEGAASISLNRTISIPGSPRQAGLWVRGDGKGLCLSATIRDSLELDYRIVFAAHINWSDWRYLEVDIPKDAAFPILLKNITISEPDTAKQASGNILLYRLDTIYASASPHAETYLFDRDSLPSWLQYDPSPQFSGKPQMRFFAFGNCLLSRDEQTGIGSFICNRIIAGINKRGGDFTITTGNLSVDGRGENLGNVRGILKRFEKPYYCALGRYETINDPYLLTYANVMFPTHYHFTTGLVSVFILDNVNGSFALSDSHQQPREPQWSWLLENLKSVKSDTIIFVCHISPVGTTTDRLSESMNPIEAEIFHKLLLREAKKGRHVLVLSGNHAGFSLKVKDGIPYFMTGGGGAPLEENLTDGNCYHYLEFNVQKNAISFSLRPIFTRLAIKRNPVKNQVGVGEEIAFTASGILDIPAKKVNRVFPLTDPMSYEWSVNEMRIATIGKRDGKFRSLGSGKAVVTLNTGEIRTSESLQILKPQ